MVGAPARDRAFGQLVDLARRGLGTHEFLDRAQEAILRAIPRVTPFQLIWHLRDPVSFRTTSSHHGSGEPTPDELHIWDNEAPDAMRTIDVARSRDGQLTIHDATRGRPETFALYGSMMAPFDLRHGVETVLRSRSGSVWGSLTLARTRHRSSGDGPGFDRDELAFLRAAAPVLALGIQRGTVGGDDGAPDAPDGPGVVLLDSDYEIESCSATAHRWLAALPGGWPQAGRVPPAVVDVAAGARAEAERDSVVLVRTANRGWATVHAASLTPSDRTVVVIEAAHPARLATLRMEAYDLTAREQQVARLVAGGRTTAQIARALVVSPHTVQEHLKHIFDKTGARSRRELTSLVFLDRLALT